MADIITTFYIKQHDLMPDLVLTALDGETPVSLETASSARFIMKRGDVVKVDRAVAILDQVTKTGQVALSWQTGDTDTVGTYKGELEVMWPAGKPQTFPAKGYLTIVVGDDLN